ncbi:hypothetical protein ON010_g1691 [Phytophthora cinnamomi]|nr:hypothetical protein ON010_g1691 [Phytophthora cinnamomi]
MCTRVTAGSDVAIVHPPAASSSGKLQAGADHLRPVWRPPPVAAARGIVIAVARWTSWRRSLAAQIGPLNGHGYT